MNLLGGIVGAFSGGGGGGGILGGLLGGGDSGGGGFLGGIMDAFKGIMDSPIGAMIGVAFPPAGMAMGALNLMDMVGGMSDQIGGGESY